MTTPTHTDELGWPFDLPTLRREVAYLSRRAGALMTWAADQIEHLTALNQRNADELDRVASDHSRMAADLARHRAEAVRLSGLLNDCRKQGQRR